MAKAYKAALGNRKQTPQSEPIPGKQMERNNAGGFSFVLDDWGRLERFLILGTVGGTYYASQQKHTKEALDVVRKCAAADFDRTLATVVQVSDSGRAIKNDEAIVALAILASDQNTQKSTQALRELPKVARIGTHLFQFVDVINGLRGWGRRLRECVADWYLTKSPADLAYQVSKYQQRESWSHRDVLRKCKVKTDDPELSGVLAWAAGYAKGKSFTDKTLELFPQTLDNYNQRRRNWLEMPTGAAATRLHAVEAAKQATSAKEIVKLIREAGLVRENIPTQYLDDIDVWAALLEHMPLTATIRNLAKLTQIGLLTMGSEATQMVVSRLRDADYLRKSRVHPFTVLMAERVYSAGRGFRGGLHWAPNSTVVAALNDAFMSTFSNVEPTGRRHLLALDVSGSMCTPMIDSMLTVRDASAALALLTVKTEPWTHCIGFTGGGGGYSYSRASGQSVQNVDELVFSNCTSLQQAVTTVSNLPMGATDCALPMLYAMHYKMPVDAFVVYTDNETWCGRIHPSQALQQYRNAMGIPAKLIVVGMTSTRFTIADPADAGMLDMVGFDASGPAVMSNFIRG